MNINERIEKLQAELDALKAEAATAPKFKVGDTAYVKVTISQVMSDGYEVEDVDGDHLEYPESSLLPSAPRLVQADPAKLKPGDEVYVKGRVRTIWSDGDVSFYTRYRTFDGVEHNDEEARLSIIANVYRLEQE